MPILEQGCFNSVDSTFRACAAEGRLPWELRIGLHRHAVGAIDSSPFEGQPMTLQLGKEVLNLRLGEAVVINWRVDNVSKSCDYVPILALKDERLGEVFEFDSVEVHTLAVFRFGV